MNRKLLAFVVSILLACVANAQVAAISANPTLGCVSLPVLFNDASTGATSWAWNFGDGIGSSTQKNPGLYTYLTAGTYTVTLIINGGASTATQKITVNPLPTVKFGANITTGCFPLTVSFTDSSLKGLGYITSSSWDFGDGTTSSQPNPTHIYTLANSPGFPVTLELTDSNGCSNTVTQSGLIKIPNGVTPSFQTIASSGCKLPITVQFNNTTTGPGTLTYLWSFGDGSDDTTITSPGHTYNASGAYNVELIATSSAGCEDSVIVPTPIVAGNVVSSFQAPDSVCVGTSINFVNTSAPQPTVYNWNFGDGTSSSMFAPTKIYSAANVYTVTLTNTFGTCIDSVSQQITVLMPSVANFTASSTISCDSLFTVQFTDQSTNASSWSWSFGDGTTSNKQNPSHTYTGYGSYSVSLVASNSAGCSGTITKSQYIQNRKPYIQLSNLTSKGCAPFSFSPTLIDTVIDGIASYTWNFGDGTTSTAVPPLTHPYPNAGTYYVTLSITTNGGCTASTIDTVQVGTIKPVVNFTASPTTVCTNKPVTFTDQSTNSPNAWLWNFGNGTDSTVENPVYSFPTPGTYIVTLIAYNNGCNDSAKKTIIVNPPLAKFSYTYSCSGNNTVFVFQDSSLGANTWLWNFGDGSPTTTVQNPSHSYVGVDNTYTVTLTVTNIATGCTNTSSQPVSIIKDTAQYAATANNFCVNNGLFITVNQVNQSQIRSYIYDFGDGTIDTASAAAAYHTYTKAGNFQVKVVLIEITGCLDTLPVNPNVIIHVSGPTAQFTPSATVGCKGLSTVFTDQSTTDGVHPIVKWIWNYGDGSPIYTSTTGPPFTHNYTKQGIYTVTLTVVDASGCLDSITKVNLITVAYPYASFTTVDSLSCPGSPIQFVNNSKGYGLTYNWSFGDGSTSTAINPTHIYAIGTYNVSLRVLDQFGCTDSALNYNVLVDTPSASFTLTGTFASCPPLVDTFAFTGSYYKSLKWIFGDGGISSLLNPVHYYNIPGTYSPYLIVTSHGGCIATAPAQTVTILGPYGTFTYSPLQGCHTLTVNFNVVTGNIVKYLWIFSPTQTDSTASDSVSFTYDSIGKYRPIVVLEDPSGCNVPIYGSDTVIVIGSIPKFGYNQNILCGNGTVQFSDSTVSTGTIGTYSWNFGDGTPPSNQENPSHFYAAPGIYSVKLTVTTTTGCQDTSVQNTFIKVVANPVVDISGATSQCIPATLNFQGIEVVIDTSVLTWNWNFYNGGQSSTSQNPPAQTYNTAGSDSIQLIATNSSGCMDTVNKYFTIYPLPPTNAGADTTICLGQSTSLMATGASTYNWLPPNNTLSCTNCANPVATPDSTTAYIVSGVSAFGCIQTDTVVVNVITPLTLSVTPTTDSLCLGQSVPLNASGETLYTWSPVTGLSNPNIANPIANPDTTTIYQVSGTDIKSCFTDTKSVAISVFNYPKVTVESNASILVGTSYQINASGSSDIDSISWTPTIGLSCTNCLSPIASPVNTTTYVVSVVNNGGCAASDSITIIVTCNNSNLFVPNTFSPNGDGMNDVFFVRGKGLSSIQSMRIFNRWGQMVFEKINFAPNDPSVGWDGTFNGKKAPMDVYIYTIEVVCENSQVVPYHGNVALIR